MAQKGVFEDSDDFEESESGEDFSASEDDWKPGKEDGISDESEDDDVVQDTDDNSDDGGSNNRRNKNKKIGKAKNGRKIVKAPKLNTSINRRHSSSLRAKMFSKYNPPPKTISRSPISAKVSDILVNSQYKQRKQMPSTSKAGGSAAATVQSDSDSSDEDGLVNPNSDFFAGNPVKPKQSNKAAPPPVFDCNAGMRLSDSDDEDGDEFDEVPNDQDSEPAKKPSIVNQINKKSSTEMHDFSSLQSFAKNLESAKAQMAKLKEKDKLKGNADETDITKLLSLGEGIPVGTPSRKRKLKDGQQHSDESDWENVSDDGDDAKAGEIKDIQITVGNQATGQRCMSREQKKAIDLEACLKRRLNRDIKEKQVFLHKSAVLCWIAHGNHINRVLNNLTLMEMCLKLLPSKNAYPKGDTDIKYFHMITDWFHSLLVLKSNKLFCELNRLPPKTRSLALQIQSKKVICKCDFVLLFVTMLRSLGIQCRLVVNFAVPPLKPPQKDLFVVSTKPKDVQESKESKPSNSKSVAKKIKASAEKMKASHKDEPIEEKRAKKTSTSKSTKAKSKASTAAADHSYAESPKTKGVKVKLSRMSPAFIEENTAEPTQRAHNSQSSPHKHPSQSPSTKLKSTKEIKLASDKDKKPSKPAKKESVSKKTTAENSVSKTDSPSSKKSKSKEIDNAAPKDSKVKKSAKQSLNDESNHVLTGTPTKNRLVDRTNGTAAIPKHATIVKVSTSVTTAFSPRKTRSKATKADEQAKSKAKLKLPQLDGANDIPKEKRKTRAKAQAKQKDLSSDDDFDPEPAKKIRAKITPQKIENKNLLKTKQIDRRVFSTDEEFEDEPNTNRMNFWVEAYAEQEKKWIVIDPVKKKVDCAEHVRKNASKPIIYVFAWNNDNTIRDVTPRYCSQFHTTTRKMRAEQLWIDDALRLYVEQKNSRTIIEDIEFSKLQMDTPMPKSINEFKNHPLYALERHMLKFEAFYPPNSLILGYIRNEPIYSRDCVHTLHSREIWVKQARTVKVGEQPYKIVKARPKWNRMLNQMEDAKPLEIFGFWQTEPYKPPVAENGVVPRNPYGNVELFKPEMLPIGTRHIQLPNLNRVCKKMGVDCAQAVTGFDFHGGSSHPTFDGFVVCEEFADDVIAQWEIEQEEQIRKETEKREARVFGNWKKLIKGLLIRERLKRKFNFGAEEKPEKGHGGKRKKQTHDE